MKASNLIEQVLDGEDPSKLVETEDLLAIRSRQAKARRDAISKNNSLRFRRKPTIEVPPKPDPVTVYQAFEKDGAYIGTSKVGQSKEDFYAELEDGGYAFDPSKTKAKEAL